VTKARSTTHPKTAEAEVAAVGGAAGAVEVVTPSSSVDREDFDRAGTYRAGTSEPGSRKIPDSHPRREAL
jgi:hypothetical protein